MRLRPTTPQDGDSPAAVIGRAHGAVARGDLAGATAALERLPPDLLNTATPWLQTAKRRLDADRLLGDLVSNALAALARAGG